MEILKSNIEKLAKEEGKSELEIITSLQTAAALAGQDELLEELSKLKWGYIPWVEAESVKGLGHRPFLLAKRKKLSS